MHGTIKAYKFPLWSQHHQHEEQWQSVEGAADPTILSWWRVISTDGNQYSRAFALSLCSRQWESWPYPVQDFTFIHLLSWNSTVKIHPPFTFIDRKLGQDSPFGVIY